MAALWRRDPRLAFLIDELPSTSLLATEPSRSGAVTAVTTTSDGRRLYLHSRYDPAGEAEQLCRKLDEERELALAVVLCGVGLGYHIPPLRERLGGEGALIVSEPDLVAIRSMLERLDVADPIASGRIIFIYALDKGDLHAKLDPQAGLLMMGTKFVVPPVSMQINADFHQQVRAAITDFAAYSKMSLLTLLSNARITCTNIANNLPAYVATPSIAALCGRYAGYPAVLVAAGPSLGRNVDQLKAAADRVVIIAMQTTLKPLLARGIRPDFVTSLDFSDLSRRFFEDVDLTGIHLVAEPKAAWEVIDTFLGGPPGIVDRPARRLGLLFNDFACRCLGEPLGVRTGLRAGSTVAHLAFYLAEFLGCRPIILIGQDLGFSGGVYYTPGVAIHDAWHPELGRFDALEMKEWERIVRARPILHKATDVFGRSIYSDEQMFTYLQQFERDFASCAAEVIDATEGGVRKTGTTVMTLAEALSRYATRPVLRESGDSRHTTFDGQQLRPAHRVLTKRLEELAEFRGLCEQTRDLLAELVTLLDRPDEFNRGIVRVDELRALVQDRPLIFRMVSDVAQFGEWQKFSADRRLAQDRARAESTKSMPPAERARRQLERDRAFINSLLEGCDILKQILTSAADRTDKLVREVEGQ